VRAPQQQFYPQRARDEIRQHLIASRPPLDYNNYIFINSVPVCCQKWLVKSLYHFKNIRARL
jgi:hypothetical protein